MATNRASHNTDLDYACIRSREAACTTGPPICTDKYYGLTERSSAYIATMVLITSQKWTWIEDNWALDWTITARLRCRISGTANISHPISQQSHQSSLDKKRLDIKSGLSRRGGNHQLLTSISNTVRHQ